MDIRELRSDPASAGNGDCAVVFYAPWCGDCVRSLEFEKKLSREFSGRVAFFRMDAEEFESIADKYGVERYPTYVFFRNGAPLPGNLAEPLSLEEARGWLEEKLKEKGD
ncbi:MAG: protein disulfide isomerase family protein [Candidatus Micrarchaeota archaeon]